MRFLSVLNNSSSLEVDYSAKQDHGKLPNCEARATLLGCSVGHLGHEEREAIT